jgi:hypothetical protein
MMRRSAAPQPGQLAQAAVLAWARRPAAPKQQPPARRAETRQPGALIRMRPAPGSQGVSSTRVERLGRAEAESPSVCRQGLSGWVQRKPRRERRRFRRR